jgi:hypothetical protein
MAAARGIYIPTAMALLPEGMQVVFLSLKSENKAKQGRIGFF